MATNHNVSNVRIKRQETKSFNMGVVLTRFQGNVDRANEGKLKTARMTSSSSGEWYMRRKFKQINVQIWQVGSIIVPVNKILKFNPLLPTLGLCLLLFSSFLMPFNTPKAFAADDIAIFPQLGHSSAVSSVSFSPDGRYIISRGTTDKNVILWDAATGKEIRTFKIDSIHAPSASFSPDGRFIVCSDFLSGVSLLEIETGKVVRKIENASLAVFSPDGHFLLFMSGKKLKLYEISSDKIVRAFQEDTGINTLAFSPDGRFALSGNKNKTLKLWDVATGKPLRTFKGHEGPVSCIAFSPDGRYAISGSGDKNDVDPKTKRYLNAISKNRDKERDKDFDGDDRTIRLWNVGNGKLVKTLKGHTVPVTSLAFSPDGRFIVSAAGHTRISSLFDKEQSDIYLWDAATGNKIKSFDGHDGPVFSVAFSPDGRFVISGGNDNTIKLWEIASGKEIRTFQNQAAPVKAVAYSPDGQFTISGTADGSIRLCDTKTGQEIRKFAGHWLAVLSLAFSRDGRYALSGSRDLTRKLWDVATGKLIKSFSGTSEPVVYVDFSPDGRYGMSEEFLGPFRIWNLETGQEIWHNTFSSHSSVVFSRNGRYLAFEGGSKKSGTLLLWDVEKDTEFKRFEGHSDSISAVAFSPDGRFILSGSWDKTLKLWDIRSGYLVRTFEGHNGNIRNANFSFDGRFIVSGDFDGNIKVWDSRNGAIINEFKASDLYWTVVFSPDGKHISFAGQWSYTGSAAVRDIATGQEWGTLQQGRVNTIVFSPDGSQIISGGEDGTMRYWDSATWNERAQFIGFRNGEWIVLSKEGYYNSSQKGEEYLNVRIGNQIFEIDQYREQFYRPDLVKIALSGEKIKGLKTLAGIKPAPTVAIVNAPSSVNRDETAITIRIVDMGGGIGDVRLYLNDSAVVLDRVRGVKVVGKDDKSIRKTYSLKLSNGKNIVRSVAFNADNSMQSRAATHEITAHFKATERPNLHALIIGIQEFENQKLNLKYAAADADVIAAAMEKIGKGLFSTVNVKKLNRKDETSKDQIVKALQSFQKIAPDDVFVLFVATHGTVEDDEYFLITSNVGITRTERLKTDALTKTELTALLANIPCTKKLVVLDTCHAGAIGDALQMALMTRGMSEDTALKILSRAVGSTVISASSAMQEAVEGYRGHGLFTYILLEGLLGKADKGQTGYIKTLDLIDYVEMEVPELADKIFKRKQYPTSAVSGQSFPIGKIK